MIHAWQQGDNAWLEEHMKSDWQDPKLLESFRCRNRKWVPKIEARSTMTRTTWLSSARHLVAAAA